MWSNFYQVFTKFGAKMALLTRFGGIWARASKFIYFEALEWAF